MRFTILSKPSGTRWLVQEAETLKDARAKARQATREGAEFFWITDRQTGELFGLRGYRRSN